MDREPVQRLEHRSGLPLEVATVWLVYLAFAGVMFITYSRLPAAELYKFNGTGLLNGGASRVLVFTNYSMALVAIPILAILAGRARSRGRVTAAVVAIVLCSAVFLPGVVDQGDLTARPVNAIAATGVLIALVLTILAARGGVGWAGRQPGDPLRVAVAIVVVILALPWLAAELGFFLDGVPLLGDVFKTGPSVPPPRLSPVHHGHHHGMDGALLLLSAVLLSRVVQSMGQPRLRRIVGALVALMAAYGIANMANDFWEEQVVKRGWTAWKIPNVVYPTATVAWGLIVLGAIALYGATSWWLRSTTDRSLRPVADG